MKNLVSLTQATKASNRKLDQLHKTRGRPKGKKIMRKSPVDAVPLTQLILRNRKQPLKRLSLPKNAEVIIRREQSGARASEGKPIGGDNKNKKPKSARTAIAVKAKNIHSCKSKVINIVAFAQERNNNSGAAAGDTKEGGDHHNVVGSADFKPSVRKTRKRKISCELNTAHLQPQVQHTHGSTDGTQHLPTVRKSARLSKDCTTACEVMKITGVKNIRLIATKRRDRLNIKRSTESFSPPLTRARLKQLTSAAAANNNLLGTV